MVALPTLYNIPAVIPKRTLREANRRADALMLRLDGISLETFRRYANHSSRRHLLQDDFIYPVQPWLERQEVLYRQQVEKSQPDPAPYQPVLHQTYTHVYHLKPLTLPYNWLGNAAWRVVHGIGSFYDCFLSAWHFTHA